MPDRWSGPEEHWDALCGFSGRSVRFLMFFTFAYLFFFLCPAICGGSFALLSTAEQAHFIVLFQTGWFLESMWTQVLILHLLRTQNVLQSRPSRPVMLVTLLGTLCFTILTFTPFGALIGLTALPWIYFVYLVVAVLLYLLWITGAKRWYVRRYHQLL